VVFALFALLSIPEEFGVFLSPVPVGGFSPLADG
jgi:hypothetical protein